MSYLGRWFGEKATDETLLSASGQTSDTNRSPVQAADTLLEPHRQRLIQIRQQVGVPQLHWDALYQTLFDRFAEFVQLLPASEAHHHRQPGGLLTHALETTLEALRIRRGVLLPPNASAEMLADKQDVWTYAVASAALIHDLGKPVVDQNIELFDRNHRTLGAWDPLSGPISHPATAYTAQYIRGRRYRLHPLLPPMLVQHIVPSVARKWLVSDLEVFEAWLATITGGDAEFSGDLGQIIREADGISVAVDLSGGLGSMTEKSSATRTFAEKLVTALRKLIDSQTLPLNRPGAAGFVIDADLWLVSKRALDALRDELVNASGTQVPARNDRLMDELQQNNIVMPNGDRAIWTATIELANWKQSLTLLRVPLSRIWLDPAARPATIAGRVVIEAASLPQSTAAESTGIAIAIGDIAGSILPDVSTPVVSLLEATVAPATMISISTEADMHESLALSPMPDGIDRAEALKILPTTPPRERAANTSPSSLEHHVSDSRIEGVSAASSPAATVHANAPTDDAFLAWLIDGIRTGRLRLNSVGARIHTTNEGLLLVSPGVFRDFAGAEGWATAQRQLMKLRLHLRLANDTNIWSYRVKGERSSSARLKGILLSQPEALLGLKLPTANPHLSLIAETPAPSISDATASVHGAETSP